MVSKKRSIRNSQSANTSKPVYNKINKKLEDMQPETQNFNLYRYLKEHGSITPIEAWFDLGIYRLSARIYDLRSRGADIRTVIIEHTTSEGDTKKRAKYVYEGEVKE